MNSLDEVLGGLKYLRRFRFLVVMAFCCSVASTGFAQLVYLTDTRSVSGSASINTNQLGAPPFYVTSYSGYSGSVTPASPFADFQGSADGAATYVGGISNSNTGQLIPITESATVEADQTSFLHAQELYFNSGEFGSCDPAVNSGAQAQGDSFLQVTFNVSVADAYNLTIRGTGDPLGSWDSYSLSSANQGVLVTGDTGTMLRAFEYGIPMNYSGTFNPGDVYTLTLESQGGQAGPGFGDGGGLIVDLTVPEPSMTALAGLAFLIFLLRGHRIGQQAIR